MKPSKKLSKTLILLIIIHAKCIKSEWFSSLGQMQDLLNTELDFLTHLENYINAENNKLQVLSRFLEKFRNSTKKPTETSDDYLNHPVNQYHLIKRLSVEWEEVASIVVEDNQHKFIPQYQSKQNQLPKEEDLKGSAEALMRLQDTYELEASQIISGNLKNFSSNEPLYVGDCYRIGRTAYEQQDYYHCSVWMREALNSMDDSFSSIDKFDVTDYLAVCLGKLNFHHEAIRLTNEMLKLHPNHTRLVENLSIYKEIAQNQDVVKHISELSREPDPRPYIHQYEELCRRPPAAPLVVRQLKCYYWTNHNHPRLLFRPIKLEELYDSPRLVRFYDVVCDEEIEEIKALAKPRLLRATVHNPDTGKLENAHYRVSKSAWFSDDDHPVFARVSRRIADVTGLSMESAESLQVANYGVAGQYEPHYDFHKVGGVLVAVYGVTINDDILEGDNIPVEEGNRIATFLIYLSDVQYGGSTVFLYPDVAVQPIKRSAVFWYNLNPSGAGDIRTRHAACPVLVGVKWVANKWIHERGQEFARRCSLNEFD